MNTVLERLPSGARVAVIRLRSLGDCVLTTPALRLLKTARPDLQLALVVERRFAPLFEQHPDVDRILMPSPPELFSWHPHLTLNLHGGARSMWLTATSLARWRAGFEHFRAQPLYNLRIPKAQQILNVQRKVHTAEHLASAVFWLGVPQQEIPRALLSSPALPAATPYAILHPFASQPDKVWPEMSFLELARYIERNLGLEPLFIGGPADEISRFAHFRTVQPELRQSMALIRGAQLFVGNDSGPAHLAAAFGIPMVALFGNSDPVVWAPWKTAAETLIAGENLASLPVDRVIDALQRLRVAA